MTTDRFLELTTAADGPALVKAMDVLDNMSRAEFKVLWRDMRALVDKHHKSEFIPELNESIPTKHIKYK